MNTTDTRDPADIEAEIRRTQEDMSRTVGRIGDQFTPRNIINGLLDKAEDHDIDARRLIDGARRNPLALALLSAGAIWLVSDYDATPAAFTSKTDDDDFDDLQGGYAYDPDHHDYVEHMSRIERMSDEDDFTYLKRRDEARGTYLMIERGHDEDHTSYRSRLDEATNRLREKRDSFADSMRQGGHQIASGGRQALNKGQNYYYDNPLLGGLAAALIGAVAGSAVPVSRLEREQLGPQGAKALDQAQAKARDVGEQALQKKDELVDKADQKLRDQAATDRG
jgi:ElaB/YqjD/DUF883 family membrane-anchored ribosome-binding protein